VIRFRKRNEMSNRAAILLAEAMTLSDEERAELMDGLLDAEAGRETDDEFVAELDRRAEEVRLDPTAAIPWEQVQHMR